MDDGGTKTAIFHHFSRINHSCGPNSVRNIVSEETGELCVIAARDIENGEEISIKVRWSFINSNNIDIYSVTFSILTWNQHHCYEIQGG